MFKWFFKTTEHHIKHKIESLKQKIIDTELSINHNSIEFEKAYTLNDNYNMKYYHKQYFTDYANLKHYKTDLEFYNNQLTKLLCNP
jgi:hypothetical protein